MTACQDSRIWTITTACQAWRVRAITRPDPSNHILDRNVSKMTKIPLWLKRGGVVPGYGLIESSATESDWVAIWWLFFSSLTRFTLSTKIIKMHTNALKIVPAHVRECHSVRRIRSKPFFPRCAKSMKFSQNTFWISDFFQTGGRTHASWTLPVQAPLVTIYCFLVNYIVQNFHPNVSGHHFQFTRLNFNLPTRFPFTWSTFRNTHSKFQFTASYSQSFNLLKVSIYPSDN